MPLTNMLSLSKTGIPCNGPRSAPLANATSASLASCSACPDISRTALRCLNRSTRAMYHDTASATDRRRER